MSIHPNLPDTHNATFSPASGDGRLPYGLPDGPPAGLSGQAPVLASLSARQARARGLLTSGIYGPSGFTSSNSADLSQCLANRLKQQLSTTGSTLFTLTWKERTTPSGRRVCLLRPSAPRTNDSGYGGWPTPQAFDASDCKSGNLGERKKRGGCSNLREHAKLAPWPTPTTRDHKDGSECPDVPTNSLLGGAAWLSHGANLNGSPAPMEKPVQLNPAFSRWLMGFPAEWDDCAPTETLSFLKRQRNLSRLTSE